jgi:hypothetical protein
MKLFESAWTFDHFTIFTDAVSARASKDGSPPTLARVARR